MSGGLKFLIGAACFAVIAASGTYLAQSAQGWLTAKTQSRMAAQELCLAKKAEAAAYRGGMDWTGQKIEYATADEYCQ